MLNSSNYCEDDIQMTHSLLYNAGWSNTLLENIDGISRRQVNIIILII
jgi:hypothetical protein